MADWSDVYKNVRQPDPLKQVGDVYGVLNADQQLRLARQAEQVRQYDLMQNQANDLLTTVGTMANTNPSNAEVRAHLAQRARQLGVHPRVYDLAAKPFVGLEGKELNRALQIHGARAYGAPGIVQREPTIEPETGAGRSVPATSLIAQPAPTSLGPASTAAQTATGGAAGAELAQARSNSLRYGEQLFPLEQAEDALIKLGTQGTGPGTETVNQIKSFLQSAGVPGIDASKITDFDKAKKYLTQYVTTVGDSATNDKLAASFAGNPSVHISNQAAVQVVQSAVAMRRYVEARTRAFEASGKPDTEYAKFASKWAREHDVRAYGFDMMTPAQRRKVLEGMPEAKRTLFKMDVNEGIESSLIREPRTLSTGGK